MENSPNTAEGTSSPFQKSSRVQRTPPGSTQTTAQKMPAGKTTADEQRVPDTSNEGEMWRYCRSLLNSMKTATDRQKNISMEVKSGLSKLREALEVLEFLRAP